MTELVALLKRLRPELPIVLGGPEVSYECDRQEIVRLADHVVTGEADLVFPEVCRKSSPGARRRRRSFRLRRRTSPRLRCRTRNTLPKTSPIG